MSNNVQTIKPSSEVRIVNDKTGGEKGQKDEAFSLLPWNELSEVAKLYHAGSKKYARDNWRRGYDWSLSYDAMCRHLVDFWERGESTHLVVEKDGREYHAHHLASVVFHALALMYFEQHHPELDDRPENN
jgi:hypothetical protein